MYKIIGADQKEYGPALVSAAGILALGVGIIVTLAISTVAVIYAYEDIFGMRPTLSEQTPVTF